MRTVSAKPSEVQAAWLLVDAKGQRLGRLASRIALILRGKHKALYTPHVDTGDHVVVINAKEVVLTGRKATQKVYTRYSGYPGGLKHIPYERLAARQPEEVLRHAVRGMLPSNHLGRKMFGKLHVYLGAVHPHTAQGPQPLGAERMPKLHG